ncbi:hypothetical protein QVD17_35317 [Tagetes erecta]|uniref:F-box domain-containing protein n=1 Tax=Tagetes erecta TaxID=13708 RepID=A0AAD8JZP8_TARER|nr:hypothetical protein QVD17_35317 [Tagetes erecta]
MLENFHFEIQMEIMNRLPIKSILQFRSLSKTCKSMIDNSAFRAHYHTHHQHLLIAHYDPFNSKAYDISYVSITDHDDDDETFPQHKHFPTVPMLVNMLEHPVVIGSSHGLVCVFGARPKNRMDSTCIRNIALIWNPCIRRVIPVFVTTAGYRMYRTFIGFGVCRATNDPKIVKITHIKHESDIERISSIPLQVEVFTLSTGVWRWPYSNLPRKSVQFVMMGNQVVVDGFMYWRGIDRVKTNDGYTSYSLIISFDITTEEFGEVNLPDSLAHEPFHKLCMANLREFLVVLHRNVETNDPEAVVWMMENGVSKLFTKLFTITVSTPYERLSGSRDASVIGFRKSGQPIIELLDDNLQSSELVVYEIYSKRIDYLDVYGLWGMCFVYPYIETLLLLDQPDLAGYNEMEATEYLDSFVS